MTLKRDSRIPDLVTVTEAAELLGVSRQAVNKMVHKGQLLGLQVGTTWVFRRAAVTDRIIPTPIHRGVPVNVNHLTNQKTHQVAAYLAATEAINHGHSVEVNREERRYTLTAENKVRVQVFSRRSGPGWQTNNVYKSLGDDTDAVVLVDLQPGNEPAFYVVPATEFRNTLIARHQETLDRHGGTRRDNPDSGHGYFDPVDAQAWLNRWDVLT